MGGGIRMITGDDGPVKDITRGFSPAGAIGASGGPRSPFDSNPLNKAGQGLEQWNPFSAGSRAGNSAKRDSEKLARKRAEETRAINTHLNKSDGQYATKYRQNSGDYLDKANSLVHDYTYRLNELDKQSNAQAKDARTTYDNSILPEYKNAMGMARGNAESAMTLKEASDPNNPIMKQIRAMYDEQGQAARKQGQQDYGVLSALGAQAAQGQFGAAGPMTSGQMGQIYGANQAQAGDAYARAQQRMHDLQQQGLDRGFDQSNQMYQFGQEAQDRYGQSIQNLQGGQQAFNDEQAKFRDERKGYSGDRLGANQGLAADRFNVGMTTADIDRGNVYGALGREQGVVDQYYGLGQQGINNQMQGRMADAQVVPGIIGSIAGGAAQGIASDRREKKGIGSISDSDLDEFLSAVKPKTFEYKDENAVGRAPGERIGFMMQDVEDTKLGRAMSRRGPSGEKMYDKDNLNGIILAGLARQAKAS